MSVYRLHHANASELHRTVVFSRLRYAMRCGLNLPHIVLTDLASHAIASRGVRSAAKQTIAEMVPRFDIRTQIKTENGTTQIVQDPRHSDMDRWRAQLMAAFGTTSTNVAPVEVKRIAKALRQRDGKIDPAELDTVIAIVSGQRPKNELEAMVIS